jgi:hypothetical protein
MGVVVHSFRAAGPCEAEGSPCRCLRDLFASAVCMFVVARVAAGCVCAYMPGQGKGEAQAVQ